MSKLVDALVKNKAQNEKVAELKRAQQAERGTEAPAVSAFERADADGPLLLESKSRELQVIEEQCLYSSEELEAKRIIHSGQEDNAVEVAFRNLRTSVLEHTGGASATILITSVGKSGGASFVSINLACALGLDVKRTAVIIDCNLKDPGYYEDLIDGDGPGLTDHLDNPEIPVDKVIYRTGIPRVRLVPAGKNRQSRRDYFTEEATDKFLRSIKRRYRERYLFLDSPPINESADTRALVKLCDHVILVVPYGGATPDQVRAASEMVGPDKLLGIVLNKEPTL